jgi:predicted AAA+ superfamily ATPase
MLKSSILQRFNQHWVTGKISETLAKPFRRPSFFNVLEDLANRQAIVITGLRRVGKTTIMFQLIQELLTRGTPPKNILYFSFDDEKNSLEEVLETYEKEILMNGFSTLQERVYVFFDEIQYSKGWEGKLKTFYDLYPEIKFIASGSASLLIEKSVREKLAGRFFSILVDPLDFREFSAMKNTTLDYVELKYAKLREAYLKQTIALPMFADYVRKGGFPELTQESNDKLIAEYIRNSVTDRVIFKDFALLIEKRDFELFEKIIRLVCSHPGMLTNYINISRDLKRDRRTISNYFRLLEYAMLLYQTSNYRKSGVSIRKLPKTYVYSTGIIFSLEPQYFTEKETLSKIIENLIVTSCKAKYFWRRQKHEVDIVLEKNKKLIPVEVKYSKEIQKKDLTGLLRFMNENKTDFGIIVSEETLNEVKQDEKTIWIIPAWLFLTVNWTKVLQL